MPGGFYTLGAALDYHVPAMARSFAPCSFPGCGKRVAWGDLCAAHQQQKARGQELKPIRVRRGGVRLPSIMVSVDCAKALEGRGPTIYLAAREVLEWWSVALPQLKGAPTSGPGTPPPPKKK